MNKYHNQVMGLGGPCIAIGKWGAGHSERKEHSRPRGQMGVRFPLATCRVWPVGAGAQGEAGSQRGDNNLG